VRTPIWPDGSNSGRQLMIAIRSRRSNAAHNCRSSSTGGEPVWPITTVVCQPAAAAMAIAIRSSLHQRRHRVIRHRTASGNHDAHIACSSQTPIAAARRPVVPMPARGFLPRGSSDACPRSALHCQVTGRHLITLNGSGRSRRRNGAAESIRGGRRDCGQGFCRSEIRFSIILPRRI
jgi:hypothetical protein